MILDKYIYINKNSLSSDFCIELIKLFENDTNKKEGRTLSGVNKSIKDTTDMDIPDNDEKWFRYHSLLNNELKRNIKKYLDMLNNTNNYINETNLKYIFFDNTNLKRGSLLMQKYTRNKGKYVYHNDFFVDSKIQQNRVITFLWYVNTVEEGGETCFGESFKIKPEQGKLILFPACWTFPHCGKMPISSDKYIITGWIYIDY
jgi:hypothetical protein